MTEPIRFYVEYRLRCLERGKESLAKILVDWSHNALQTGKFDGFSKFNELIGFIPERHQAEEIFRTFEEFISQFAPEFRLQSLEGERIAKLILLEHCEKALEGKLSADNLMGLYYKIEHHFSRDEGRVRLLPEWVVDLYNICDVYPDDNFSAPTIESLLKFSRELRSSLDTKK